MCSFTWIWLDLVGFLEFTICPPTLRFHLRWATAGQVGATRDLRAAFEGGGAPVRGEGGRGPFPMALLLVPYKVGVGWTGATSCISRLFGLISFD